MSITKTSARRSFRKGFTLIELLLVIGIVAVISTVVILALNPQELMRHARDARRLAEASSMLKAVNFLASQKSVSLGDPTKIYVSLPDDVSPTCASHTDLPLPPPGYSYHCSTKADYRKIDGSGWIPVDFQIPSGSPISILPIDPVNTAVAGYYYIYVAKTNYAIVSLLESEKYLKRAAIKDDGTDDGRIEFGDVAVWAPASGIKGLWRLDEPSGSAAVSDSSGVLNNGTGIFAFTGGFVPGKFGNAAKFIGSANGGNITITESSPSSLFHSSTTAILAWVNRADTFNWAIYGDYFNTIPAQKETYLAISGNSSAANITLYTNNAGNNSVAPVSFTTAFPMNSWAHLGFVWSEGITKYYTNGSLVGQQAVSHIPNAMNNQYHIGFQPGYASFNGMLDEMRVYNRPLHPAEIQAIHKATK